MANPVELTIEGLREFSRIGSGGFATVYVAFDEGFARWVAVKVLDTVDDDGRRRFDRERALMGRLDGHPNVVTPYRFGYTASGSPYLVMEHLAGGSLDDLIARSGPIPVDQAVDLVLPIAAALGKAHEQTVLHRDVKPANVLLTSDGVPKLTDFGISGMKEATATQRAFTLAHSPPETFADVEQRDERSDLYSLASTLFTLVVGQPPFEGIDGRLGLAAQINRILTQPIPGTADENLDLFLARAMATEPDARPANASQFIAELRATRSSQSAFAPPSGPAEPTRIVGSRPPPIGSPPAPSSYRVTPGAVGPGPPAPTPQTSASQAPPPQAAAPAPQARPPAPPPSWAPAPVPGPGVAGTPPAPVDDRWPAPASPPRPSQDQIHSTLSDGQQVMPPAPGWQVYRSSSAASQRSINPTPEAPASSVGFSVPAFGAGFGVTLLGFVALLGVTLPAVLLASLIGVGIGVGIGSSRDDFPSSGPPRGPIGGVPFHELWMRRRSKKRDWFRGQS